MSRIKVYGTYTEIINGLFVDIENEKSSITKNDIEEILVKITDTNNTSDREIILYSSLEGLTQFNRAMQEAVYRQTTNMSEQELIQYFDRISQEEEN